MTKSRIIFHIISYNRKIRLEYHKNWKMCQIRNFQLRISLQVYKIYYFWGYWPKVLRKYFHKKIHSTRYSRQSQFFNRIRGQLMCPS